MKNKQTSRVFRLSRSLRRLGRCVGRRNRWAIAGQAVKDERICNKVVKLLGKKVEKEMKKMFALSTRSILRQRDPTSLEEFELGSVIKDMEKHAPNTLSLLRSCLAGRKQSKASRLKTKGRTKPRVIDADRVVIVCCAILLRGRSQRMNILQRIVSLILYCGHASKRVSKTKYTMFFCVLYFYTCIGTYICINLCLCCVCV